VASSGPAPTAPCPSCAGGSRAGRRTPELDAGLQVGSHQSRAEGQNPLTRPAGQNAFDAAQDTVGLGGCECTLPGHVKLLVNQHPEVLLLRVALYPFSTQPVFVLGIASTCVQDPALGLVELHEVHKATTSQSKLY